MTSPIVILICIGSVLLAIRFFAPGKGKLSRDPPRYRYATGTLLLYLGAQPLITTLAKRAGFDIASRPEYILYLVLPIIALMLYSNQVLRQRRNKSGD